MVKAGHPVLVPGAPIPPPFPLARYRPPQLQGVVRQLLDSATEPGDLVLAVNMSGGLPAAEALQSGCRLLVLNRNPVESLWIHTDLNPVALEEVQAALTELGDLRKGDRPLSNHIREQYASRCPLCRAQGVAEWFAWDRGAGRPFYKSVICPKCDGAQEGPVDDRDVAVAGEFPPRETPAFHLALSRIARPDDPVYAHAADLLRLYTERNLGVLLDILNRLPQLHVTADARTILIALILEAMDLGSNLSAYAAPTERLRTLRTPHRFLERNVWIVLERALKTYAAQAGLRVSGQAADKPTLPTLLADSATMSVTSVPALLAQTKPAYLLLGRSIRELNPEPLRGAVQALILEIRPPDATWWALSILWATWLWGPRETSELKGFLQRRRLEWEWYRKSLATALSYLKPLLSQGALILAVSPTDGVAPVRALTYAANRADLEIQRWITSAPNGYRFLLRAVEGGRDSRGASRPGEIEPAPMLADFLAQRGEPTRQDDLEAACILESREPDLAGVDPEASAQFIALGDHLLWFRKPVRVEKPLADRVESEVLELLLQREQWTYAELTARLYERFHGLLSPEPELVAACVDAYATREPGGRLALRPEDEPGRRKQETQQLRDDITSLGRQLGYRVSRRLNADIVWQDEDQQSYVFRCSTTAVLGPHLLKPPPSDGHRCLIIPGGRAALTALKLRRDPRLSELTHVDNWAFIKFRHLRRMVDEIKQRSEMEVYLGLDPIVERESAQLTLPL